MKGLFHRERRLQHSSLAELNITPLLDLVFVLLVIFIITTPQMTNSLEVNLPSGKRPPPKTEPPKHENHRIFLDETGRTFLDGKAQSTPGLKEQLTKLKTADPEIGVIVEAADEADYQSMVNVLDLLRELDLTKVGLATEAATPNQQPGGTPN